MTDCVGGVAQIRCCATGAYRPIDELVGLTKKIREETWQRTLLPIACSEIMNRKLSVREIGS